MSDNLIYKKKNVFEEKGINTFPISFSAYNAFSARNIKTLMRNIKV